ncbi:MAG: IS200/IS605 family transposase [Bacteroidota bacterium]
MPHSFNNIWIHAIWSTKNWQNLILPQVEKEIFNHMHKQFNEMGCKVKVINGMADHVHCLFMLNPQKAITEVMKQIKGSTAYYVNQSDLIRDKFGWQTGYGAFSVSESQIEKVHSYIINQKDHHKKRSFKEEYHEFLKRNGINEE